MDTVFDLAMCQEHTLASKRAQVTLIGVELSFSFEKEQKRNFLLDCEVGFQEWGVRVEGRGSIGTT